MIGQHSQGGRRASRTWRAGRLLALLGLLAGAGLMPFGAVQAARPAQTGPRGTIPHTAVDPYGTNAFLQKEAEQVKVTHTLDLVAGANLAWIKQDFPWNDIEIAKKGDFTDARNGPVKSAWDKYDFIVNQAAQRHLQVVARISFAPTWARPQGSGDNDAPTHYSDLADFAVALLDHFQGRVNYIQVWNEPNLAYEWKAKGKVDPAAYTEMLKTVYTRVKQTHPDVSVLSAPMAINLETLDIAGNLNELDYWDQMYKAGAKAYFDILSANAYGLDLPPADPPSKAKLNFRRVELLRDVMVQNDDANKAVWFNEYGWNASPTTLSQDEQNHWRRVDPATQAQWTVDGIQYALDNWPWSGVFFIWYFRQVGDIPTDKAEYYFRLVDPDFTIQPVYKAVRHAAGLYKGPGAPGSAAGAATPAGATPPAGAATPAGATTPAASDQGTAPTGTPVVGGAPTPATAGGGATAAAATAAPAAVTPATTGVVAATPVAPAVDTGSAGTNPIWLILGGILVLAGIAAVGFYLMRRPAAS